MALIYHPSAVVTPPPPLPSQMDGQELGGRWLKIMLSFERPGNSRNGEAKPKPEGCTTVFIGNLSWSIDEVRVHSVHALVLAAGQGLGVDLLCGSDHMEKWNGWEMNRRWCGFDDGPERWM